MTLNVVTEVLMIVIFGLFAKKALVVFKFLWYVHALVASPSGKADCACLRVANSVVAFEG